MDFNNLIGTIQVALSALQLKLDHFKNSKSKDEKIEIDRFYDIGEAIRILEYALAETVSFIGQTNERKPNPRLAALWDDASRSIRRTSEGADLADLTFEKNLFWRNPDFYRDQDANRLYRISLENVLIQLRRLRAQYDQAQRKRNL